jgi:hypothetical protein
VAPAPQRVPERDDAADGVDGDRLVLVAVAVAAAASARRAERDAGLPAGLAPEL